MWRRIALRTFGFAVIAFIVFVLMAAATGITTRQTRTATPGNFAGTTAEGTSLSHARADHVHTPTSSSAILVDAGLFGATASYKAQGSGLLLGDPNGGATQTEGVWIGFNDFGIAHGTLKQLNTAPQTFRFCDSSATGPPACNATGLIDIKPASDQVGQGASNRSLVLLGNRSAADAGSDIILIGSVARTAGNILEVDEQGATHFIVDHAGNSAWSNNASPTLSSSDTNSGMVIRGNKNAADTGADVILNGAVTRTAGILTDFESNGTSKASVLFDGVVDAPNVMRISRSTADDAVTGTTMQSVAGLSFSVKANAEYYAEFTLLANTSATARHDIRLTGPATPTKIVIGDQGLFGSTLQSGFGAAAFSTAFELQPANVTTEAFARVYMVLINSTNAGTVQLQHATSTAGQTATIFRGSNVRWQRMDGGLP